MSTVKGRVDPKKGFSSLIRPRFSPGLMLQDSDLNVAVDYSRSLTQLLFKHLFGCGVICGYEVSATVDPCNILEVKITRGLALDCLGSPVELSQVEIIRVEKTCMHLYENEGITPTIRRAFVVYLASHNRPPHEVLSPALRDITQDYDRTFVGMTTEPVKLVDLLSVHDRLVADLPETLIRTSGSFFSRLSAMHPTGRHSILPT